MVSFVHPGKKVWCLLFTLAKNAWCLLGLVSFVRLPLKTAQVRISIMVGKYIEFGIIKKVIQIKPSLNIYRIITVSNQNLVITSPFLFENERM